MTRSGRWFSLLSALAASCCVAGPGAGRAEAVTEIQWWHAMTAALGEMDQRPRGRLQQVAVRVQGRRRLQGDLPRDHDRARSPPSAPSSTPQIVQVFEVGTATMMAAKGAIKPVYELMADAGEKFDPKAYLPAVTGYYTTADGKMLSLPLNSSTPVLYFNKDAFKKAGLDPAKPPRTWPEMGEAGKKLQAAGLPCGFTSRVAAVDPARELLRLAQPADRDEGERLRRLRHRAPAEQPRPRQAHPAARRVAEDEALRLRRAPR